mmetsp:Transcript_28802/g.33459  ORF Transcript_28802/g.33459 Transcript_28802/m.33459 type:complete len:154 (-) Transcript_28802:235-696(-)
MHLLEKLVRQDHRDHRESFLTELYSQEELPLSILDIILFQLDLELGNRCTVHMSMDNSLAATSGRAHAPEGSSFLSTHSHFFHLSASQSAGDAIENRSSSFIQLHRPQVTGQFFFTSSKVHLKSVDFLAAQSHCFSGLKPGSVKRVDELTHHG